MAYLVVGVGESFISDIRTADNDEENWDVAKVLMPTAVRAALDEQARGEHWCVLIESTDGRDGELDRDAAVIAYSELAFDDWQFVVDSCRRGAANRAELETLGAIS